MKNFFLSLCTATLVALFLNLSAGEVFAASITDTITEVTLKRGSESTLNLINADLPTGIIDVAGNPPAQPNPQAAFINAGQINFTIPGATVNIGVTAVTGDVTWRATGYRISTSRGTSFVCVNHADHGPSSDPVTQTISASGAGVPSSPAGIRHLFIKTYSTNNCDGGNQEGWTGTGAPLIYGNVFNLTDADIFTGDVSDLIGSELEPVGDPENTEEIDVLSDILLEVPVPGSETKSTILLPAGTKITSINGESFDAYDLTKQTPPSGSLSGLATGKVVEGAVQWGIENFGLEFDNPITVTLNVGENLNGQTLQIQRSTSGIGGWTTDGIVAPATCTVSNGLCVFQATKASFYAALGSVPQPPSPGSSSGGSSSAPSCGDSQPTGTPDLFQIDTNNTQAILYFAPVSDANNYYISYGEGENTQVHGVQFDSGISTGVLSYTINSLAPNTTYSFKVRGGNGCMPGDWGNTMQVKTTTASQGGMTYYKNFIARILSVFPKQVTNAGSGNNVLTNSSQVKGCQQYTVEVGDSLWNIASNNLGSGAQYQSIMQSNNLSSTLLNVGQVLNVGCQ